jgi:hypothetical protein
VVAGPQLCTVAPTVLRWAPPRGTLVRKE